MDIALIVLASASLIALIVLILIVLLKKPSNKTFDNESIKEIGSIETKDEQLSQTINKDIELAMTKSMNEIITQGRTNNELSNEKLDKFQISINI